MSRKDFWAFWYFVFIIVSNGECVESGNKLQLQPFGVQMCSHFCARVSSCRFITYAQRNLSCQIGDVVNQATSNREGIYVSQVGSHWMTTGNKTCSFGDIVLRSRTKKFQCIKYGREPEDMLHKGRQGRGEDLPNMTPDTYKICERLYQLCDSGKKNEARSQLYKLCDKTKHVRSSLRYMLLVYVMQHGCDLTHVNRLNETILHGAIKCVFVHVVKCVLSKKKISIEKRGQSGKTPIMYATSHGYKELFQILLTVGSDLSKVDIGGNTILHMACSGGNIDIIGSLLQRIDRATMTKRNKKGKTP